jgi:Domain of unknown function (DUF932)
MDVVSTAASQYANRPADERFPSIAAFVAAAEEDRNLSAERSINLKDLHAVGQDGEVKLISPQGAPATFTNWSFGQLARTIGAPAKYLATLSPELASLCVNEGIKATPAGTRVNVLLRAANGHPEPTIRACTSDTYGRAWDCELIDAAARTVFAGRSQGREWQNAPTWAGETIAGFRGDRDSFVLQIDGGSIVTDPSAHGDGRMFRGIMIRNSETGASSITIEVVLFRYICGNWNLWGAAIGRQFRRRHVGKTVVRDAVRELDQIARAFTARPASADETLIRLLIQHDIASTRDGVIDELRAMGATKDQAEAAYLQCEQHEGASPRSFWGLAQGLTRLSQEAAHTDERYEIDKLAGVLLSRASKLVAT